MHQLPTSLVLFHCRFSSRGLSDHRAYPFELSTYVALPHLYAVCAIDDSCHTERMISGFLVKTSVGHAETSFLDTMAAAFETVPQLRDGSLEYSSLLSAQVRVPSQHPLTEEQALVVFNELWSDHVASQLMVQ